MEQPWSTPFFGIGEALPQQKSETKALLLDRGKEDLSPKWVSGATYFQSTIHGLLNFWLEGQRIFLFKPSKAIFGLLPLPLPPPQALGSSRPFWTAPLGHRPNTQSLVPNRKDSGPWSWQLTSWKCAGPLDQQKVVGVWHKYVHDIYIYIYICIYIYIEIMQWVYSLFAPRTTASVPNLLPQPRPGRSALGSEGGSGRGGGGVGGVFTHEQMHGPRRTFWQHCSFCTLTLRGVGGGGWGGCFQSRPSACQTQSTHSQATELPSTFTCTTCRFYKSTALICSLTWSQQCSCASWFSFELQKQEAESQLARFKLSRNEPVCAQ